MLYHVCGCGSESSPQTVLGSWRRLWQGRGREERGGERKDEKKVDRDEEEREG